jgi:DNA-binding transcriptional MerR regulator
VTWTQASDRHHAIFDQGAVNLPRDNGVSPVKLYYRIGQVAELVGVEPHVLRYWESEFPTIRPQKSRSGQRVYSRRDVEKLLRVKELLYAQRFTIAGARQRLRGSAAANQVLADSPQADAVDIDQSPSDSILRGEGTEGGPAEAKTNASDTMRAAATILRSTLLGVREQVVDLLDDIERGARDPGP